MRLELLRRAIDNLRHGWSLARRLPTEQQFLDGMPINYGGLLFLLDPVDETLIHIAIPLDDFDRSEIPDMVREAREIFVDFVRERPSLEKVVADRVLLVRIVTSYDRFNQEVGQRERIENWRNDVQRAEA